MATPALWRALCEELYEVGLAACTRRFWRTVAAMCVGLTLFAVAVNGVLIPHHLSASGATGVALTLYYLCGWPSVGVFYWLINVPILVLGWRVLSLEAVVIALLGVGLSGATLQLTQGVTLPCHDTMMAAILAGSFSGFGVGFYLRYGGSAGGLDVVALVMRRKWGVSMGQTFFVVNWLNVLAAALIGGGLEQGFYTAIAVFVHARMVDRMQSGFSERKAAFIITAEPDKLAHRITRTLRRGCTFFTAEGGMTRQPMRVVYTVVNFMELARLKEIVYALDAKAFLSVTTTAEVIGNRFMTWEDEGIARRRRQRRKSAAQARTTGASESERFVPSDTTQNEPAPPPPSTPTTPSSPSTPAQKDKTQHG